MTSPKQQNTYSIFFSVLSDSVDIKRLAWIKKFIKDGLGPTIHIEESMIFSVLFEFSAIIIASSDSIQEIEESVKNAKNDFSIKIEKCNYYHRRTELHDFNHCILIKRDDANEVGSPNFELNTTNSYIHTAIQLKSNAINYSDLLFVNKNDDFCINTEFSKTIPYERFITREVCSFSHYIERGPSSISKEVMNEMETATAISIKEDVQLDKGIIHNNSYDSAFIASFENDQTNLNEILPKRIEAKSISNIPVDSNVYFWKSMSGQFKMNLLWGEVNPKPIPKNIATNAPIPDQAQLVNPGNLLLYNLQSTIDTFHWNSDIGTWLQDILLSTKYDKEWPEDCYIDNEEKLKSYEYILSELRKKGIKTKPKEGTIPPDQINQIKFPKDQGLNEEIFTEVSDHLQDIGSYVLNESNVWFAGNGLFHSLLIETSTVSQNDLTAVASLLNIPPETSFIEIIMDEIVGDLTFFVGAIPGVGPLLATIIHLGWTIAKQEMAPDNQPKPKQVAIANMADELNDYLSNTLSAISAQLEIINGNWGKLEEFSLGVINKKITPAMFGMERVSENNKAPKEYIDAIIKSWRVICYKRMMPAFYKVSCHMYTMSSIPQPIFNKAKGSYNYSYYLKCEWLDNSKNKQNGFVQMYYSTQAPTAVLEDLFSENKLNLNPIEFYMGLNGWQGGIPDYNVGNTLHQPIRKVYL